MKCMRLTLAVLLLTLLGACANPAAPKYPQEQDEEKQPPEPDQQGLVVTQVETFWV